MKRGSMVELDETGELDGVGYRRQRGSVVVCHFRASACWPAGQRSSSASSTSPVAELRHRDSGCDSSRQYPGAQPLSNTTRAAASGSAFTTSPVVLFRQSGCTAD